MVPATIMTNIDSPIGSGGFTGKGSRVGIRQTPKNPTMHGEKYYLPLSFDRNKIELC